MKKSSFLQNVDNLPDYNENKLHNRIIVTVAVLHATDFIYLDNNSYSQQNNAGTL
jgi:hypothetical protein